MQVDNLIEICYTTLQWNVAMENINIELSSRWEHINASFDGVVEKFLYENYIKM